MATIRQIREENYISRRTLATSAGVSESTIVRIEEGTNLTRKDVIDKVLAALSGLTGQQITLNDIEGITLYNVMRDRKQRTKAHEEGDSAA